MITGLVVATAAPSLIESKVYSEIDSLIDNLKSKISFDGIFDGILDGILDGLGQDFKRQIKEKAKKDGWFRTIMVLLRIKAGAEKINNSDLNGTEKISKIVNIIKQEGFKFNFNFSFNSIFNLFG